CPNRQVARRVPFSGVRLANVSPDYAPQSLLELRLAFHQCALAQKRLNPYRHDLSIWLQEMVTNRWHTCFCSRLAQALLCACHLPAFCGSCARDLQLLARTARLEQPTDRHRACAFPGAC